MLAAVWGEGQCVSGQVSAREQRGCRKRVAERAPGAPTFPPLPWGPALSSCGWTVGGCAGWEQGGGGQGPSQREGSSESLGLLKMATEFSPLV